MQLRFLDLQFCL